MRTLNSAIASDMASTPCSLGINRPSITSPIGGLTLLSSTKKQMAIRSIKIAPMSSIFLTFKKKTKEWFACQLYANQS